MAIIATIAIVAIIAMMAIVELRACMAVIKRRVSTTLSHYDSTTILPRISE